VGKRDVAAANDADPVLHPVLTLSLPAQLTVIAVLGVRRTRSWIPLAADPEVAVAAGVAAFFLGW
jgi:hypothetical protein